MTEPARVRAVVLNYNGGDLTLECLRRLRATEWPADGFQVVRVVKETGGSGAMVTDDEILDGIQLLARTEGIFTEPAGGTTLAATRKLIERGVIKPDESIVVCITGNGYKTAEVVRDRVATPTQIGRSLADFDRVIGSRLKVTASV